METLNLRVEALIKRGFGEFLSQEQLEIAAAFVEKRKSPRFGDNLPESEFDGWAETVCSGLAGWGGNITSVCYVNIERMFKDKGIWTNRDYLVAQEIEITQQKVKEKLANFFDGNIVNFQKLSSASAMAAISNGWAMAVDIADYQRGSLNLSKYYHDLVVYVSAQKELELTFPKSA